MSKEYSPKDIEKKWQDIWDKEEAFKVGVDKAKPKYYALVEFPYPSGQGLHVGHPRPYTAMDIVSRKRRMQGYNVLFPMDGTRSDFQQKTTRSKTRFTQRL